MLASIAKYFHHLFNPHCTECKELDFCSNCEVLKEMLATKEANEQKLINTIISLNAPKEVVAKEFEEKEFKPIPPRHISWRVRQAMLEQEDRVKASIMSNLKKEGIKSTEELEKELIDAS